MKTLLSIFSLAVLLAAGCSRSAVHGPAGESSENKVSYCSGSSASQSGRVQYPVSPRYAHLHGLGQMFTANDCGSQRLKTVVGFTYTYGSLIVLSSAPDQKLQETLTAIGYSCDGGENSDCKKWKLEKAVDVSDLLNLKAYAEKIEYEDCVYCG